MRHLIEQQILIDLEQKGLRRNLCQLDSPQGRDIIVNGKKVLNFCSNDYLGLANDDRLKKTFIDSIHALGLGAGASRLVCGHMVSHEQLEKKLAQFKNTARALVFSSGFMANMGILSSLCNDQDIIFADKLNHASLIDGMRLSRAKYRRYPHKDMETLKSWLSQSQSLRRRWIVTDSVFSMDGDLAPLDKIVDLAKRYQAMVMIDEAHGFGILGEKGKGAAEYFGVDQEIDVQMGTLSKAVGLLGGYCCGSVELIEFLINQSRTFIYTTALPPAMAATAVKAIEMIEEQKEKRLYLLALAQQLIERLKELGFDTSDSQTPIIPVVVKDSAVAVAFSKKMFEQGIFLQAIRPPTVPINSARLRLTLTAHHRQEDIEVLLVTMKRIGQELKVIG